MNFININVNQDLNFNAFLNKPLIFLIFHSVLEQFHFLNVFFLLFIDQFKFFIDLVLLLEQFNFLFSWWHSHWWIRLASYWHADDGEGLVPALSVKSAHMRWDTFSSCMIGVPVLLIGISAHHWAESSQFSFKVVIVTILVTVVWAVFVVPATIMVLCWDNGCERS